MHLKRFIASAFLAAGLLAGCGGAEGDAAVSPEQENQVEAFATPGPCTDACDAKYYQCYFGGIDPYTCSTNRAYCISRCP